MSPFLHQPLKSTVHTSLRAAASRPLLKRPASGARRRRRFCVRPVLSKTLLNVLALATSPCRRKYNSRILRGPRPRAPASSARFHTPLPLAVARNGFSAAAILLSSRPNLYPAKTLLPLVARLGADSIFLAESAKIERPHRSHCKLHSLFHRFIFLPRHAEVLPHHATQKCYLCIEPIVLPMF